MSRRDYRIIDVLLSQLLALLLASQVYALGTDTHASINHYVVRMAPTDFSLDRHLKAQLDITEGIETELLAPLNGKWPNYKIWEWFREGGILEDSPWYYTDTRSRHHYHNPLNDQGFSGIAGAGIISGESAITWSQKPPETQSPDGFYSWNDVRGYFYEALTASDQITKERKFAETFRGLGQLMHLIQDMSVPEHVRDDGHYLGAAHLATHYEQWVADTSNVRVDPEDGILSVSGVTIEPLFFHFAELKNPSPFPSTAPVPVANLFDTGRYGWPEISDLPDPSVTKDNAIGLSEYTNANFLSPDTMFTTQFPYPLADECIVRVDGRNGRKYLASRGSGQQVDHLASVGWLYFYRMKYFPEDYLFLPLGLDSLCYEEYASHLIPRAVGYSATFLKYFFRGELSVQEYPIYSEDYHAVTGVRLRIKNVTPSGEAMRNGIFSVSCGYVAESGEEVSLRVEDYQVLELLHGGETEHQFIFENDQSVPIDRFGSIKCMLVFKGDLGNEIQATDAEGNVASFGAVVGKAFTLSKFDEPWDGTLAGNYEWYHTYAYTQLENGETYNGIGSLIKENIRWAGYSTPRVNESYVLFKDGQSSDGLYISAKSRLQFKIDELWINAVPPAPEGMTTNLQALELHFNQGRHFQFSQEGQFMYFNDTTAYAVFPLGVPIDLGIYELFEAASIDIPKPLYLQYINFIQQLLMLEEPSTEEHLQRMKVDYIRIVEPQE
ncbi:MAG: hypothetical protein JXD19_06050 [Deltaproteobacteria bacterium]|nr:hypothetical protein [Deltaproteobacteria bacterium]